MEETFKLTLSDSIMNKISSRLNEIPLTVTALELIIPGFLDDATWQYKAVRPYFIEDYLPQMEYLFSNIPLHIRKLKIDSSSTLTMSNVSFINELMLVYCYYSLYCSRVKTIALLFAQLSSNINEISFSNIPFYLLPEQLLKLMRNSLPFIETVNISAGLINKMSKNALVHLSAITPNASHYELFNAQFGAESCYTTGIVKTPKLLFMVNMPTMNMQNTSKIFIFLEQQKKLPLDCICHIIEYLPLLSNQVNYHETRRNIYTNKVTHDLFIVLLANSSLAQFSSLGNQDKLFQLMPYLVLLVKLGLFRLIILINELIRSTPNCKHNVISLLTLGGICTYLLPLVIDSIWTISTMHGEFYNMQRVLSPARLLYEQCGTLYKQGFKQGDLSASLVQVKKYSFFNERDNSSQEYLKSADERESSINLGNNS